ncbi:MAG: trehalose-6-phosphate synthase, partial [Actinomycetota bacterium]|nr:trehalose-6-phosphate synthase [Actinomycetota bacterium]
SFRGPVVHSRDDNGRAQAAAASGGLVTGLLALPAFDDRGTWVCAAMTEEDRLVAEEGPVTVEVRGRKVVVRMVALEPQAQHQTSAVAANPVLWFLQHELWDLGTHPTFARDEHAAFAGYAAVNAAFGDAVVQELDRRGEDTVVMLHDYHLYLVAAHVRDHRPAAFLHHFVHIPWPPPETWRTLPSALADLLLRGLLANDVVAFHTEGYVRNFLDTCEQLLSLPVDREAGVVYVDGRSVAVRWYPISLDPEALRAFAAGPEVREERLALQANRADQLIVRVDRADPSKNIVRGFWALDQMFIDHPELLGRVTMLALVQPTRQDIPQYIDYLSEIRRAGAEINERYGTDDWKPLDLRIGEGLARAVAAYQEADVLLVNPVRDGMNLVAKEGVLLNERDAVLVLSHQAGVFEEIGAFALGVHPLDVMEQAGALHHALTMPLEERRARLNASRAVVERNDAGRWLDQQLQDVAQIRSDRGVDPGIGHE